MSVLPAVLFFSISLAIITTSCSSSTITVKPIGTSQTVKQQKAVQIIIRFLNNSDPSTPSFVEELSRDAHASLFYVRPISGRTHVFGITGTETSTAEILRRIRIRRDIEYIEQDMIMRPAVN